MKRSPFAAFRVGVIVAAAIFLFSFSIFYIGYGSLLLKRTAMLEARFHRTNGLIADAPVALNGVNIGKVFAVTFPADPDADYVLVRMSVDQSAFMRMRSDSVATIRTMGLLGDEYIEITNGRSASHLRAGQALESIEPFSYEAMFQERGAQDFVENMTAVSADLRSILESLNGGKGLLGQFIKGEAVAPDDQMKLADVRQGFTNIAHLTEDMDKTFQALNNGRTPLGALLSPRGPASDMISNMNGAAQSMKTAAASVSSAAESLSRLAARYGQGEGTIPRLFTDRQFGDDFLLNLRESTADLHEILRKLNSGQGTLGLVINDARLYYNANAFLAQGPGWGLQIMNAFYDVTHPFTPQSDVETEPPPITAADALQHRNGAQTQVDP